MSSRREVLIRIALLQRKTFIETKKSHIKMLKMALLDCVVNEKYCSVDRVRGICPLFSSPPRGIWQLKPHPREFATQGKKNANARESARGGGNGLGTDWCIRLSMLLCRREKRETMKRLGSSLLNCRTIWGIGATMDTMIIETITRIRVLKYV